MNSLIFSKHNEKKDDSNIPCISRDIASFRWRNYRYFLKIRVWSAHEDRNILVLNFLHLWITRVFLGVFESSFFLKCLVSSKESKNVTYKLIERSPEEWKWRKWQKWCTFPCSVLALWVRLNRKYTLIEELITY